MRNLFIVSLLVIFALYTVRADNEQKRKCIFGLAPACEGDDSKECQKAATDFQNCSLNQPCKNSSNDEQSIQCLQNCKGEYPKIQEFVQEMIDCINSQNILIFSGIIMSQLLFLF